MQKFWIFTYTFLLMFFAVVAYGGDLCVLPDNGTGTVTLPPIGCQFTSPDEVFMIIEGLPAGTTIEMEGILMDFVCSAQSCIQCTLLLAPGQCETAGGSLGGHGHCFEATLDLTASGTGSLTGFNRHLSIPVFGEVHTGPRNPGDPVQSFDQVFYRLEGELFGDPDFCTFRIIGGSANGLSSPGQCTLTDLGGGLYNVDSFFDITYQIEFEGCPGSQLNGYMGTTTATISMETGQEPPVCQPLPDGSGCTSAICPETGDVCQPSCVKYNPVTEKITVVECDCRADNECAVDIIGPTQDRCVQPDNGTGTITLPPRGCTYPCAEGEEFKIIEGLPPNATIELDGQLMDMICCGSQCNICSLGMNPGQCEKAGGTLGGDGHCFEATLDFDVTGTGTLAGFNRHISIPIEGEIHTGPRNPGDPVQTFQAVFYRLQGELFGDPDFCTLRIVAGTDYGLPSPGEYTLTELPSGDFAVDSFFDITYQIEFEGCPGSVLDEYMGTTTSTVRIQLPSPEPTCQGDCQVCDFCRQTTVFNQDDTVTICCECQPNADLNRDGKVDMEDMAIVGSQWLLDVPIP